MEQSRLSLVISNLTDEEIEQQEQETELLAKALVEQFGELFWAKFFAGEFSSLN